MIDLTSHCLRQYKLNDNSEDSAQVLDSVGNQHGTYVADPGYLPETANYSNISGYPPHLGRCLLFNSRVGESQGHISVPSYTFGADWSVSLWLRKIMFGGCQVIGNWGSPNGLIEVKQDDYVKFQNGPGQIATWNCNPPATDWIHLVMTGKQQQGEVRLFIDTIDQGARNIYTAWVYDTLGGGFNQTGMRGYLDNVCLFNKVISQAEIEFLHSSGWGTESLTAPIHRVYAGRDGAIDYNAPVAVMAPGDSQVEIPKQDLPPDSIWHYARRAISGCGLESDSSPACVVRIDAEGNMIGNTPNPPLDLIARPSAGGKMVLKWRYSPIDQEVAASGFNIYIDSGSGFNFSTPDATVDYTGAAEFGWTSGALIDGVLHRFCVTSYRTGAGESPTTARTSGVPDSTGPEAISGLLINVEQYF